MSCHRHHPKGPPSLLSNNPSPEQDPSLPAGSGYRKISLPLLHRCLSDPIPLDASLCGSSCFGGSLPTTMGSQCSPDHRKFPKTPPPSPTQVLPPLPPPHTLRRTVSDMNPSPAKSSRFSTSSQDVGSDIDTPNSKRLRRMKDRLREMSHWCQKVMLEEDLMQDEKGEEEQLVEEEQVQNEDAGTEDQDAHGNAAPAEDDGENLFAESVSVEKKDDCLVVHFRCHCEKGYQFLLSGGECYYKLM